jgi:hypothetical protein
MTTAYVGFTCIYSGNIPRENVRPWKGFSRLKNNDKDKKIER